MSERHPNPATGHTIHIELPFNLNTNTSQLVLEFAVALATKLASAEKKYGRQDDWLTQDWEKECRRQMFDHISKGDPLDVAAYCAFMWRRGWRTVNNRLEDLRRKDCRDFDDCQYPDCGCPINFNSP